MKWPMPKDPINVGYHVVAFVDLAGQRKLLGEAGILLDLKNEQGKGQWFREYFAPVIYFRQIFYDFFKESLSAESTSFIVPADKKDIWDKMRRKKIGIQPFTDSFVIYVCLKEDPDVPVPAGSVFLLLGSCGSSILSTLAQGHALRAGIDVGIAAELYENEVYGPALMQAYKLESEVAIYPRIVIGKNLLDYLQSVLRSEGTDVYSQLSKRMASICQNLLSTDTDGQTILDYLGQGFREHIAYGPAREQLEKVVPLAYNFVRQQEERWEKDGDEELARRYKLLKNYFVSRLDLWKIKQ